MFESGIMDRLENLRRNVGSLFIVELPHIRAAKNLRRNNEIGELAEYYNNIIIIVKYKTLLYGMLSLKILAEYS
jgi:hypothetical protein